MRRAVVTGIGAVTPVGGTMARAWEAVKRGECGIGPITRFDASGLKWSVAGEIKNSFDASAFLAPKEARRADPFSVYAAASAIMALEDAGLRPPVEGQVIAGTSRGAATLMEAAFFSECKKLPPFFMPSSAAGMAASLIARKLGLRGGAAGISSACASGLQALGEAFRLVRHGLAGLVIACGADAPVTRLCVEGYGRAGALSRSNIKNPKEASRPFHPERDGFVLSEGACSLVVEEYGRAARRGAQIYGEIAGYGQGIDPSHETRPSPPGWARTISAALRDAGVEDTGLIIPHAASTVLGDAAEEEAIFTALGKTAARKIPAFPVKALTGHMLAASGPFEAAIALMCMKEGIVPPNYYLKEARMKEAPPGLNLGGGIFLKTARPGSALVNAFGFGGFSASVVLYSARS
ncbi:MAG: beta-ketoacyl-[acyl-carrier-protein] synthase family protein [Nitrospiraceae bacterium]|nr:beta-ketoacyl-[acyl-carrier-protein] synthase family protein [Nitrospiraceae bacterium]